MEKIFLLLFVSFTFANGSIWADGATTCPTGENWDEGLYRCTSSLPTSNSAVDRTNYTRADWDQSADSLTDSTQERMGFMDIEDDDAESKIPATTPPKPIHTLGSGRVDPSGAMNNTASPSDPESSSSRNSSVAGGSSTTY